MVLRHFAALERCQLDLAAAQTSLGCIAVSQEQSEMFHLALHSNPQVNWIHRSGTLAIDAEISFADTCAGSSLLLCSGSLCSPLPLTC